jgi:hypothetical protein
MEPSPKRKPPGSSGIVLSRHGCPDPAAWAKVPAVPRLPTPYAERPGRRCRAARAVPVSVSGQMRGAKATKNAASATRVQVIAPTIRVVPPDPASSCNSPAAHNSMAVASA